MKINSKTFVLLSALSVSCVNPAIREATDRTPANTESYGASKSETPPQIPRPTFSELQKFVMERGTRSVEETLPWFAKKYSDYFRFHTLMYNSLSIHETSFEKPRAIVFGPDAKFILTFNGDASQRGGNTFETAEYSEATHSFNFREIEFRPTSSAHDSQLKPNEIEFENRDLRISKANPQKCLQCHGPSANPIWASYFVWPGAYGSNDDSLAMSFVRSAWGPNNSLLSVSTRPQSQGRLMEIASGHRDYEVDGMIAYLRAKPTHPRYKWLPPQFVESGLQRFSHGESFASIDESSKVNAECKRYKVDCVWPSAPNLFFLDALQALNQDRILFRVRQLGLKEALKITSSENTIFSPFYYAPDRTKSTSARERIRQAATAIAGAFKKLTLKNGQPSVSDVEEKLTSNVLAEIAMQREKVQMQDRNLGKGVLMYRPYADGSDTKFFSEWMGPPQAFYMDLLGMNDMSELDKIAFHLESDNLLRLTAVQIFLESHGVELKDYNMNLRQDATVFHSGGLERVFSFLGL